MADRFPLIVDSSGTPAIKEIVSGDVLDLTGTTIKAISVDGTSTFTGVATASASANITQVALTSSSNAVAWDAAAAANAYHVTTENTTFSAPTNATEGAIISEEIKADFF